MIKQQKRDNKSQNKGYVTMIMYPELWIKPLPSKDCSVNPITYHVINPENGKSIYSSFDATTTIQYGIDHVQDDGKLVLKEGVYYNVHFNVNQAKKLGFEIVGESSSSNCSIFL